MANKLCNRCGKPIEKYNDFRVDYRYTFESPEHDNGRLKLHLCYECINECTQLLINSCKINPIIEQK